MDFKPKGTPNPLNPNVETGPVIEPSPVKPTAPMRPAGMPNQARPMNMSRPQPTPQSTMPQMRSAAPQPTPMSSMPNMRPASAPAQPAPMSMSTPMPMTSSPSPSGNLGVITNVNGTVSNINTMDPMGRPMQKEVAPEQIKPKKSRKRTKLIIGMVISLFIAVGCAVAALLVVLSTPKTDMVAVAMNRMMTGQTSTNIMVDGTINIKFRGNTSEIASIGINIGSELKAGSLINSTMAKLNVSLKNGNSFSMEVAEVYATDGDLYFKVNGLKDMLDSNINILDEETSLAIGSALEVVDGNWLRITANDLQNILPSNITSDNSYSCAASLIGNLNSNTNLISNAYLQYPFIFSTDEDLAVTSQRDPIYKVIIDDQSLRAFLNETTSSELVKNLSTCVGHTGNTDIKDRLANAVKELPEIYVEVDEAGNFTRFYTSTEELSGEYTATADFLFSYPTNVNISEPKEFKDVKDLTF